MPNTFKKAERLTGEILIQKVFASKKRFLEHPIKVNYVFSQNIEDAYPLKVLITCPKRNFKKAVNRNHIKRLIREAYRIHKSKLNDALLAQKSTLVITLVYIGNEIPKYEYIERKIILVLERLSETVQFNTTIVK